MEPAIASRRLRLAGLTAITLCLGALVVRRLATPAPVYAGVDSAADRCHLVPNENDRLVVYDPRSHCLLSFVAVNGTELRLQGWRNTADDPRLWDTSQIKSIPAYAALETKNGTTMQYLRPVRNRAQGSMVANMEEKRRQLQFALDGLAGEDSVPQAGGR